MGSIVMDPEARRLLESLPALLRTFGPAQLVTVVHVQGSAPRAPGARLLCRDGLLLAGTIGGGHLEQRAMREAAEVARKTPSEPEVHRYQLGPELAQCCGGVVELLLETIDLPRAEELALAVRISQRDDAPLVTVAGERVLREVPGAVRAVIVFGAGHVGTALAHVLAVLPWRIIVIDPRPEWGDPARFPSHVEVICERPIGVVATWGWLGPQAAGSSLKIDALPPEPNMATASAVIMTHDHGIDRDLADALLRVGERAVERAVSGLAYVGVIGSKTKIVTLRRRLRERGLTDVQLDKLVAPIGLRHGGALLGGKLPGEIAIGVAAQLVARASRGSAEP